MGRRAFSRAAITRRLFNTPLAATPETAAIVLGAIGKRLDVSQLIVPTDDREIGRDELEALAADRRLELSAQAGTDQVAPTVEARRLMPIVSGIAFVEVRGELVSENGIGPMSGFTGYDGIRAQVLAADADPNVRGIVLDIDSPGGEVSGLYECAAALMARRGKKPMRAVIRGVGASAACALSVCADPGEVTIHELGLGGSIGTIMMHVDYSQAMAQDGVAVTMIMSGSHKADGNAFEPLPDNVRARLQALCDQANDKFIAHVAMARGLDPSAVRDQQAQIYQGEEAVAAGLADKVMSWDDSIAEFTAAVNGDRPGGASPATGANQETRMTETTTAPEASAKPAITEEQLSAARTETETAERQRIADLIELDADSKVSDPLAKAIADGTSPGQFAIDRNRAARETQASALDGLRSDAVQPEILPQKGGDKQVGAKPNRGQAVVDRMRGKHPGLPAQG